MCVASTCLALVLAGLMPSIAAELSGLKPGLYVSAKVGCSGLGGAGTIDFDGQNFSGHYQVCRTEALSDAKDHYRSTCIEAQGPDWPTLEDINKNPDKTTEDAKILVISKTAFTKNGARYNYCGAR